MTLSRVLETLAVDGHLQSFDWTWGPDSLTGGQPPIPPIVWEALAKNGKSLTLLNVTPTMEGSGQCYEDSWVSAY